MIEQIKQSKNALIILAVVVIGFLLWRFVFQEEAPLLIIETQSPTDILAQDLENQLNVLRSLRDVDTTLFTNAVLVNLQDIETPIQLRPIGKSNPFLLSQ